MSTATLPATEHRVIRAPRGPQRTCQGWIQEAALRMLMNNLDPDVAEDPDRLVVYGGSGRAARSWHDFDTIVATLRKLANDETLLVQSGKPVGVIRTHDLAPRVIIANSLLVPKWATWEEFRRLEAMGLTMYGQMTAGSWIYIGSQGILQGTYETFAACAARHFGGSLAGRLVVTAGLGGMGGAQPLAATMNGAAFLAAEVNEERIHRRIQTGYLNSVESDIHRAIDVAVAARDKRTVWSGGVVCNAVELLEAAAPPWHRPRRADRSNVGPRSAQRLRPGRSAIPRCPAAACRRPDRVRSSLARDGGSTRPRHAGIEAPRRRHLRLRQQPPRRRG